MANKNENKNKHLFYLNELSDYKIASDDPDVRGWSVKDKDNRVIGKVDNLLVNKNTERVVYLDVEVDSSIIEADHDPYGKPANDDVHEFINKEGENHIIIPVGLVKLNNDQNFVYTDRIDHRTFAETKRIEKGAAVNREYEVVVLESYDRDNRDGKKNTHSSTRDSDQRTTGDNRSSNDNDRNTDGRTNVAGTDSSLGNAGSDRPTGEKSSYDSTGNSRDHQTGGRTSGDADRRKDDNTNVSDRRQHDPAFQENERRGSSTGEGSVDSARNDNHGRRGDDNTYRSDRDRGRTTDDDSFYERREFDGSNYRRKE